MSKSTIKLMATTSTSPADIFAQLSEELDAELVEVIRHDVGQVKAVVAVFERYYLRTGSYASLTVSLLGNGEGVLADLIGAGGGSGLLNIALGANDDIVRLAAETLEKLGFIELL